MEDQGKRLLLAVVLALGVVVLWNVIFPSEPSKPAKKPTTAESVDGQPVIPTNDSPVGRDKDGKLPVAEPGPAEPPIVRDYPGIHVEFSSRNGVLSSWRLTDKKFERDFVKGELVGDPKRGMFGVNFVNLGRDKVSDVVIPQDAVWRGEELDGDVIRYTYEGQGLRIVKTFRVHPADYLIEMDVQIENLGTQPLTQTLAISAVGVYPKGASAKRPTNANCRLNGDIRARSAKSLASGDTRQLHGTVTWVAFNNPYLFSAISPRETSGNLSCYLHPVDAIAGGMQVDIVYPMSQHGANAAWSTAVVGYIGPKFLEKLEGANDYTYAAYKGDTSFTPHFDQSVDMGWFSFIARPLLSLLTWFYSFTGNWGVAIILLTILVKLATLYWTTKSMRSMKAMAALKPHMDELQKKYPDDRQRLQQEMMGLYKQHGVSPLAGCLPMLLQMPIWLALYKMLGSVGELYLSPFIPGWLDDLTATDPYYILPVVLMGLMFLQSKMSPASLDSMQQKMLVYGLPLMFGVMSFFFPSGLSVYILTNTVLSLLHTLYMKHFDRSAKMPLPIKKPVATAAAAAAGPAPRDRRKVVSKPAPKVIDVEAEEVSDDEDDEAPEDEDDDSERAPSPAAQAPRPSKNSPRRKRKRGGRH